MIGLKLQVACISPFELFDKLVKNKDLPKKNCQLIITSF